jgi:competence protein ComFC
MDILSILFPKRCVLCKKIGSFLCPDCFIKLSFDTKSFCLYCGKPSSSGLTHLSCKRKYVIDGCFSALSYNFVSKKLLYSFKNKPFLTELKDVLTDLFYESLIQNEEFIKFTAGKKWIIIPMPLSVSKLRKRGYNQSEILAKELGKRFGFPIKKIHEKVSDINIILVDDVVKTGSAFLETARILKKSGARTVVGLTLA